MEWLQAKEMEKREAHPKVRLSLFASALESQLLLLHIGIDDEQYYDESEDHHRLDKYQAQNQCRLDTVIGTRVARHPFTCGRSYASLTDTAQPRADTEANDRPDDTKSDLECAGFRGALCSGAALRESR